MSSSNGASRVAAINSQIISNGGVSTQQSPAQVSGAISKSLSTPTTAPSGAVNATGQVVDSGGKVLGAANPKDAYGAGATQAEPTETPANPTQQASAQSGIPSGIQGAPPLTGTVQNQATQAIDQLKQKYGKALTDITGTKVPAPANQGSANAGIQTAIGTQPKATPPPPEVVGGLMETDPNFDSIFTSYDEHFSPLNQKTSLVDEYTSLSKSLGLDSINAELINDKKIIDGTEDDIRNEITAAGGFATDSQVQAMAVSRNKQLIKNYNALLDTKNATTTQLSTMMNLSIEDRKMAESEFDNKLNFGFKVAEFQQRATDNARQGMQNFISNITALGGNGYDALYQATGGVSHNVSLVEKTLGLPPGGLQAASTLQSTKAEKDALEIQGLKLDNAKKSNDLKSDGGGGSTTITTPNGNINVPTLLSPYVKTSYDGIQYADLSSLTPSDKAKYAQIAQASGIKPILDTGTSGKLSAISVSKENLQNISDSLTKVLDNSNPTSQGVGNSVKSFLGNADIKSYNAWRTAIINNVQALAGGEGSGLRINKAEIDSAMENDLPVITGVNADNLSTAQAKLSKLNSQLNTWSRQILGGGNTSSSHVPPVGTVVNSGGKSYHVIDSQGNLEPI